MNREGLAAVMEQVFEECRLLRAAGQKEYAHEDDNAFRNFESIAADLGMRRESVLYVYFKKHLDGIVAWINGHRSQREEVEGRINDAIVYLCILRGMVQEDKESAKRTERRGELLDVVAHRVGWEG